MDTDQKASCRLLPDNDELPLQTPTISTQGRCHLLQRPLDHTDPVDRQIGRLPPRLRWAAGVARLTVREPADGLDRALVRARLLVRGRQPGHTYTPDSDWHERLHRKLGLAWPCAATADFETVWDGVVDAVRQQGLSLGRGTYGGWDDGDAGFARAIWCLTSHLRPRKVVETGVARGITSRVVLEALERVGGGRLWSIDLPALDPTLHSEIGIAVPERLHGQWTYLTGTSRRRLPKLLAQTAPIDLFIHDSSHTERNVSFELEQAWGAIRRGAIVADDIQQSAAFASFSSRTPSATSFVVDADDGSAQFGIVLKGF